MKKLRESMVSKAIAYILILFFTVTAFFSAAIVLVNAKYQWYSKDGATVERDIYNETAVYTVELLFNQLSHGYADYEEMPVIEKGQELISGETSASAFGYTITDGQDQEDGTLIRSVHADLKKAKDIYTFNYDHGAEKIEVYLGEIQEGRIPGALYSRYSLMHKVYDYRMSAIATGIFSIILGLCLLIFLMTSVSRKTTERIFIKKLPVEILCAAAALLVLCTVAVDNELFFDPGLDLLIVMLAVNVMVLAAAATGFLLILAMKIKGKNLWKSSLCCRIIQFFFKALKWIGKNGYDLLIAIPLVWRSALILSAGILINFFIIVFIGNNGGMFFLWFIGAVLVFAAGIYTALGLRKLKTAGQHLAEGDLDYYVDKKGLFLDLAQHADALNSISRGMARAVEEKMKSERFKTELITNVSHDIKTPLTSIINYVDFLKQEGLDGGKAGEYIEVLDRQSQRLKKLTEDLIEASKAATGTVKLDMQPCQVDVLMTQVMGEYKEKAAAQELTMVFPAPDEKLKILADGRNMWRIFDNLLNNVCKYSQPGTRVYQLLEKKEGQAVITYKNISRYELNISGEELMERFVRGDKSRNTEGSGLGLSIAKNLTELQGGNFRIDIDGDLFKVTITFELLNENKGVS